MLRIAARDGVVFQLAEAARESDMLSTTNVLIAQEQDPVLEQVRPDLSEKTIVVDRVGELDVHQFGANGVGNLFDTHGVLLR
jgi:hypothetical protein